MPPELVASQRSVKIMVPAAAANTEIGFQNKIITVNEGMVSDFSQYI